MCSCNKCHKHTTDICFYVPFCIVFIFIGIVQIISGIFYFITIPVIKLILNVAIGCWAILCGISGGMVACVCPSTPRKHEFLLYCSLSVLVLNLINLVLLEFGQVREVFNVHLQKIMSKEYDVLESENGRFITTYSAILSILVAFVETQINFCFLSRSQSRHKKEKCLRKMRRGQYIDTDQAADLEYVIPKKNESNGSRKQSMDTTVQVYAKSWVFEGTGEDEYRHPGEMSSSASISSVSPAQSPANNHLNNPNLKNNKIRRTSKLSDANSERFNTQLSSFSRCATPSPVPNSGQITPTNATFSDYLEANYVVNKLKTNRLTVDYIPSPVRIVANESVPTTAAIIVNSQAAPPKYTTKTNVQGSNGPSSLSSQQDDSQYASMLAELEQSLMDKKIQATNMSPDDTSLTASTDKFGSSKSSSKDLEFSKELEAALQLIQELETPSEGPADGQNAIATKFARSESEKTLSAAVSLPSPEQVPYTMKTPEAQTPQNGKHHYKRKNVVHIEPSSQSTSGYSSPNSFSSNAQLSHASSGIGTSPTNDTIYASDQSNVVRIYIDPNGQCTTTAPSKPTNKNAPTESNPPSNATNTLNRKNSNNLLQKGHILNASNLIETVDMHKQSTDSLNKSFLLFKKRSKLMPHSDFQNRIFKSECLAYLTDEELVARHKCNREVIRKIEQSVAQKIRGSPRYDEYRT